MDQYQHGGTGEVARNLHATEKRRDRACAGVARASTRSFKEEFIKTSLTKESVDKCAASRPYKEIVSPVLQVWRDDGSVSRKLEKNIHTHTHTHQVST